MAVQSSVERVKTINTDILAFDSKQNNSKQNDSPDLGIDSFTINFAATDRRNQDPIAAYASVEAGTMLEWLNNDVVSHKIISGTLTKGPTDAIYSNEIEPNDKFTFDTSSPGTYAFYDPILVECEWNTTCNRLTRICGKYNFRHHNSL